MAFGGPSFPTHFSLLRASLNSHPKAYAPSSTDAKVHTLRPTADGWDEQELLIAIQESLALSSIDYVSSRSEAHTLYNVGSTCWLNAVLQSMFIENPVYLDLARQKSEQGNETAQLILKILQLAEQTPSKQINEELYQAIVTLRDLLPDLAKGIQHDPSEGLKKIFEKMDLELPYLSRGTYLKAVDGSKDSYPVVADTPEITFSNRNFSSLQEGILNDYMKPSILRGDERCTFDGGEPKDTYKFDFFIRPVNLPQTLVIQAPRFDFSLEDDVFVGKKNTKKIIFDNFLYIPTYDASGKVLISILKLRLSAVIAHIGDRASSGHYVTYRRLSPSKFTRHDDSRPVLEVGAEEAHATFLDQGYIAKYDFVEELDAKSEKIPFNLKFQTFDEFIPQETAHAQSLPHLSEEEMSAEDSEDDWVFIETLEKSHLEHSSKSPTPPPSPQGELSMPNIDSKTVYVAEQTISPKLDDIFDGWDNFEADLPLQERDTHLIEIALGLPSRNT